MKSRMTLILLFCLLHFYSSNAQPCNVHAFHAQSQQELDNFSILHGTCEEFNGDIYISGVEVKNLDVISQLKVIHGSLTIMNTDVSIMEFNQLQSLGGGLYIENNNKLKKIDTFNNLDTIGNGIYIIRHKFLEEISGFEKLSRVRGVVEINYNQVLKKVNGFGNLETIEGSLFIFENSLLNELSGFDSLDSIGYDIDFRSNFSLKRIESFTKLRVVNENMHFWANPVLEYIGDFNSLKRIGRELNIESNEKLSTIEGFANLEYLKSLFIDYSDSLSNIAIFSELHSVDSSLVLLNTGLENLQFLSELKSVKDFALLVNDRLVNLEGLESLEIAGDLRISRNAVFESTKGLSSLTHCGTLHISQNPVFNRVEDLLMINTQELGEVVIEKNPILSDSQSPFFCKLITEAPAKLSLYRNGPGCSYTVEIADACQVNVGCNAINAYLINHVDLTEFLEQNQNCTSLNNVFIGSGVNHLEGMESINTIHGYLEMFTTSQANMEVLENIIWIGGDLRVSGWAASPNLEELKNLTHIGGDFIMENNSNVTAFDGLQKLKTIHGKVFLYFNNFETFGEWPALESVGGLELIANRELKESTGFSQLKEITGDFRLTGNSKLEILSGFDSLERIGGTLNFRNVATHTIAPFNSLQEIGADFYITSRSNLKNIGPHPNLSKLGGSFILFATDSLIAADYFPQLTEIEGNIIIESTRNLQSLSFFKQLTHLGGGLALIENFGLRTLEAFEFIDSVAFLTIDQQRLDSLTGFQRLTYIAQDLTLGNNHDMNTFELPELDKIEGNFVSHGSIQKLSMPKLNEVGKDLVLRILHTFNLEGLPSIARIGGKFEIHQAFNLETLSGMPDELIIEGPIKLTNNFRLNWCQSVPVCNALQDTERPHEIRMNGSGCENLQKVMDECLLLDTEEIIGKKISVSVYPNPAKYVFNISLENSAPISSDLKILLRDIYGKISNQSSIPSGIQNAIIDISNLSPGMYILSIRAVSGQNIASQKIIIHR